MTTWFHMLAFPRFFSISLAGFVLPIVMLFVAGGVHAQSSKEKPLDIVIPAPLSGTEPLYLHIEKLLKLALEHTEPEGGRGFVIHRDVPANQERQLRELERSKINVTWSVLTHKREERYLAVPFPVLGGLFNYRILLVNSADEAIDAITTVEQLKQYTAIQGYDWPDKRILEENGYKVKGGEYQLAFSLLRTGYVDYFPRAALEVDSELTRYDGVKVANDLAFYYPNNIVFYVHQKNTELYDRIYNGLSQIYESGEMLALLRTSSLFSSACQYLAGKQVINLSIENSKLGEQLAQHPFKVDCDVLLLSETR